MLGHFFVFFVVGLAIKVTEDEVLRNTSYAQHFYANLIDLAAVMLLYHFAIW